MKKPLSRRTVESYKARFLSALVGASFAKLRECEVILLSAIAQSKGGTRLQISRGEAEELLIAVREMMTKTEGGAQ